MRNSFILFLSFRNLLQRPLRSVLTALGIAIGVGTIVFLVALGTGLRNTVIGQVSSPAVRRTVVVAASGSEKGAISPEDVAVLSRLPMVEAAEPEFITAGQLSLDANAAEAAIHVVGSDYFSFRDLGFKAGGPLGGVVINPALAALLQPKAELAQLLGRDVSVTVAGSARALTLPVAGIVDEQSAPRAYLSRQDIAPGEEAGYASLILRLRDASAVSVDAARSEASRLGYRTEYVGDTTSQIGNLFAIFTAILGSFGGVALAVSILGSINTLTVNLLEKTREVGFMKATGVQEKDIRRIFLTEALLLSVTGGTLGVLMACGAAGIAILVVGRLAEPGALAGVQLFHFTFPLFAWTYLGVIGLGLLTGLPPARRASGISPLRALRSE